MLQPRRRLINSSAVLAIVVALAAFAGCTSRRPPVSSPEPPPGPAGSVLESNAGWATFYGNELRGRRTASGQRFNPSARVAAHPRYPFGTRVRVTNLTNRRAVIVTIIDRGPARAQQAAGIIIDLSEGAAKRLDFIRAGRARVRVDVLRWGKD